jgi:hypothetical protein
MTTEDRFWSKVNKTANCWIWIGAKSKKSKRGNFRPGGCAQKISAHRFSWILKNGPIPSGLCILHKCDIPDCVNPDHLFLGTQADNIADMDKKGRRKTVCVKPFKRGAQNIVAKLTEKDVYEIRAIYKRGDISQKKIADRFSVSQTLISAIINRKIWAH